MSCVNGAGSCCAGVIVGVIVFLTNIGYFNTEYCGLNITVCLGIVADHAHTFMVRVDHPRMASSSWIMHHVTEQKSSKAGFINMTLLAFAVTKPE